MVSNINTLAAQPSVGLLNSTHIYDIQVHVEIIAFPLIDIRVVLLEFINQRLSSLIINEGVFCG